MERVIVSALDFDPSAPTEWQGGDIEKSLRKLTFTSNRRWTVDLAPELGSALLRIDLRPEAIDRLLRELDREEAFRRLFVARKDLKLAWLPFTKLAADAPSCARLAAPPTSHRTGKDVTVALIGLSDAEDDAPLPGGVERFLVDGRKVVGVTNGNEITKSHATHMALLIAGEHTGSASRAKLKSYRVQRIWDVCCAIDHALEDPAVRVICTACAPESPDAAGEIEALERAIDRARRRNVVFLAAAGNEPESTVLPPANARATITIGGLKGGVVTSPSLEERCKPTLLGDSERHHLALIDGELGCFGGTSAATPMIAGIVATWFEENPALTWDQVRTLLEESCTPQGHLLREEQGFGLFDRERAAMATVPKPRTGAPERPINTGSTPECMTPPG